MIQLPHAETEEPDTQPEPDDDFVWDIDPTEWVEVRSDDRYEVQPDARATA